MMIILWRWSLMRMYVKDARKLVVNYNREMSDRDGPLGGKYWDIYCFIIYIYYCVILCVAIFTGMRALWNTEEIGHFLFEIILSKFVIFNIFFWNPHNTMWGSQFKQKYPPLSFIHPPNSTFYLLPFMMMQPTSIEDHKDEENKEWKITSCFSSSSPRKYLILFAINTRSCPCYGEMRRSFFLPSYFIFIYIIY